MQVNTIATTASQDILAELYGQVTSGQDALLACIQRVLGCDRAALIEAPSHSPLISMDGLFLLPIDAPDSSNTYLALEYADSVLATERLRSPVVLKILPHIKQAMAMAVRIARQEAELRSTLYVLEHHPIPMVIIDDKWREVFSNCAALELLDQAPPISSARLPAGRTDRRRSLTAAVMSREAKHKINNLLSGESDESVLLPMTLGSTTLRMLVTPAKATRLFRHFSRDRLVWIYLLGSPLFNQLKTNIRFRQLGLSAAESELVVLMVQGDKTLNDMARLRGVSSQTIKKQLRSVFRKTRCDSQESLLCFLFERVIQYSPGACRDRGW